VPKLATKKINFFWGNDPRSVFLDVNEHIIPFRFCPKDYHPFNPSDVGKYVVGDDYTPTWEVNTMNIKGFVVV
jgi:hypothetical protein